jgi:hypothetical protein
MTRFSSSAIFACLVCVTIGAGGMLARQQAVNQDAQTQADFKKRIDAYMALHQRLEKQVPPVKPKDEPERIKGSQEALAKAIRAERKGARQGDVFTPEFANLFRRLMYPELKGPDAADTKKAMRDDAPAPSTIPLKVNATYPENATLPTVPPNLLANLPQLPKDLEYRIIGKDLILRDVQANLIVDYIANAIR